MPKPLPRGDKLLTMYRMQEALQPKVNKGRPMADFSQDEHIDELMTNAFAFMSELFEAFNEVGWKPWATSHHFNRDAFHGEMVDAFHFFMNMMLHAGMKPNDLLRGYIKKNAENHRRQDEGYDGVSSKCPHCKREYSDLGVVCKPGIHIDKGITQLQAAQRMGALSTRSRARAA